MTRTKDGFADLIAALTIFKKYGNPYSPTHCSHDVMTICGVQPIDVSEEDRKTLNDLGFFCNMDDADEDSEPVYPEDDSFRSFRFGSA